MWSRTLVCFQSPQDASRLSCDPLRVSKLQFENHQTTKLHTQNSNFNLNHMITTKCHIDFIIHWPKGINNNGIIIISVTEDTLLYYHTCGVFSFTNGMGTTEEEKAGSAVKVLIPLTAICPVDRKLLKLDHVSSQNSQSQCTSWPVRTEKVLCFL